LLSFLHVVVVVSGGYQVVCHMLLTAIIRWYSQFPRLLYFVLVSLALGIVFGRAIMVLTVIPAH
jgi:hypothetical protein